MGWKEIIHDPSQLVLDKSGQLIFSTSGTAGKGLQRWSLDPKTGVLSEKASIFNDNKPKWTKKVQKWNKTGEFDAPAMPSADVIYYTVYDENRRTVHDYIGRAYYSSGAWIDDGVVVHSEGEKNHPRAMDPSVFNDHSGNPWLVFGSHAGGIYVSKLDPDSGLLAHKPKKTWAGDDNSDARFKHIASGLIIDEENIIEAPYIYPYDGYYYLFVNWGGCCSGSKSTYNIRIGRSNTPSGPYLDKDGFDLSNAGGTIFLDAVGSQKGPGHAGIISLRDGRHLFTYHYYDSLLKGTSKLGLRKLIWEDGWPILGSVIKVKHADNLAYNSEVDDEYEGVFEEISDDIDEFLKAYENVSSPFKWRSIDGKDILTLTEKITGEELDSRDVVNLLDIKAKRPIELHDLEDSLYDLADEYGHFDDDIDFEDGYDDVTLKIDEFLEEYADLRSPFKWRSVDGKDILTLTEQIIGEELDSRDVINLLGINPKRPIEFYDLEDSLYALADEYGDFDDRHYRFTGEKSFDPIINNSANIRTPACASTEINFISDENDNLRSDFRSINGLENNNQKEYFAQELGVDTFTLVPDH
ncbi:arabinan endo-1,5-alpha-L-arabinosidase [Synechococcus sp. MIT S1220]|uniref:arabinan endo-1,5-alpha-L-arabinosidase n=1 Tax=Synechococcus sp. MIT S1220 TaxID=3082549 RepID=UPI0039B05DC7